MASSTIRPARSADHGGAVLISGASFAGLATAYWLNRLGYRVCIVESAQELRRGGTPVDIEGETIDILTRMGLADAVRAKALPPRRFEFKNEADMTLGGIGTAGDQASHERYEIHRDDLLDILFGAVATDVELLFGRSIDRLEEQQDAVSVTFNDGDRRDFALIFGCDGNRSNTRKLIFGDGEQFSHFMGGYFFLKVVPQTGLLAANMSEVFSVPGRTAMLNGYDDRTDIGFGFRTQGEIDYDYRDRAQQRRLIHERFDALGWKVPAMLAASADDDDFYFDRINQIRMPSWSRGRVALVGDAGYCVSPLAGFGGSMAIIGAGRLAAALERYPGDHTAAFRHYEDGLRLFVEDVQNRAADDGMSMMCPADADELAARDQKIAAGDIGF
ncbi:FAD-dependent monooxygenase [Sphingomonas sp. BAUL-RG-20F-R05-02]|uniref:FAD-dependent monooxygenase n=1 Tax=Sphingomonas sp. BAUL-RG-20F-R05-02 TaxID=2914830 RepID=UPI001F5A3EE2|nr:FAD-dependent monooxygenase [Sphingomonas sp. BAUL-RG-20F-R05-02]